MSKILLVDCGVEFDKHEKSTMKEATNELASLLSSLNFGSEEMLIEKLCAIDRRGIC